MTNPLKVLREEHRIIQRGLGALRGMSQMLEGGENVPPDELRQILDFLREFADRFHHRKEEALLFPALEKEGWSREDGPIGVLLGEHEVGRSLVLRLSAAVDRYAGGEPGSAFQFAEGASTYLELLISHISKEEAFFEVAEGRLHPHTLSSLGEAFEETEKTQPSGWRDAHLRLAEELERRWTPRVQGTAASRPRASDRDGPIFGERTQRSRSGRLWEAGRAEGSER